MRTSKVTLFTLCSSAALLLAACACPQPAGYVAPNTGPDRVAAQPGQPAQPQPDRVPAQPGPDRVPATPGQPGPDRTPATPGQPGPDRVPSTPGKPPTGPALPQQGQPCPQKQCAEGLTCLSYYGIAGARGPTFTSCEIPCPGNKKNACPAGQVCGTIADGPGEVCRPRA